MAAHEEDLRDVVARANFNNDDTDPCARIRGLWRVVLLQGYQDLVVMCSRAMEAHSWINKHNFPIYDTPEALSPQVLAFLKALDEIQAFFNEFSGDGFLGLCGAAGLDSKKVMARYREVAKDALTAFYQPYYVKALELRAAGSTDPTKKMADPDHNRKRMKERQRKMRLLRKMKTLV